MGVLVLYMWPPLYALWLFSSIFMAYLCRQNISCLLHLYLPTCRQIYPAFQPVYWRTSFPVTYFCRTHTQVRWHSPAQSRPHPGSFQSFCHYPTQCHCPFQYQFLLKFYQVIIKVKVHWCIHFIKENPLFFYTVRHLRVLVEIIDHRSFLPVIVWS